MTAVTRRTKQTRTWRSWCGEVQDLRRVVAMVGELAESRWSEIRSSELSKNAGDATRISKQVAVEMEIVDGTDSVSGAPDAVLAELDRRTVQSVKIAADFPEGDDEVLSVSFSKGAGKSIHPDSSTVSARGSSDEADGVTLLVESRNPGWAKQCLAQLSDEIDKSVPKWSFFLSPFGQVSTLVFVLLVAYGIAVGIEARHMHEGLGNASQLTAFVGIVVAFFIYTMSSSVTRAWHWMFPSFELYGEGGSSSASRRIAAVVAFVASIIAGLLASLIT